MLKEQCDLSLIPGILAARRAIGEVVDPPPAKTLRRRGAFRRRRATPAESPTGPPRLTSWERRSSLDTEGSELSEGSEAARDELLAMPAKVRMACHKVHKEEWGNWGWRKRLSTVVKYSKVLDEEERLQAAKDTPPAQPAPNHVFLRNPLGEAFPFFQPVPLLPSSIPHPARQLPTHSATADNAPIAAPRRPTPPRCSVRKVNSQQAPGQQGRVERVVEPGPFMEWIPQLLFTFATPPPSCTTPSPIPSPPLLSASPVQPPPSPPPSPPVTTPSPPQSPPSCYRLDLRKLLTTARCPPESCKVVLPSEVREADSLASILHTVLQGHPLPLPCSSVPSVPRETPRTPHHDDQGLVPHVIPLQAAQPQPSTTAQNEKRHLTRPKTASTSLRAPRSVVTVHKTHRRAFRPVSASCFKGHV
eukprot:Sspe_Gene.99922::Locus_74088_Transcript_1_1_Confidence_1.000_Length_1256::g.99922::m.99922